MINRNPQKSWKKKPELDLNRGPALENRNDLDDIENNIPKNMAYHVATNPEVELKNQPATNAPINPAINPKHKAKIVRIVNPIIKPEKDLTLIGNEKPSFLLQNHATELFGLSLNGKMHHIITDTFDIVASPDNRLVTFQMLYVKNTTESEVIAKYGEFVDVLTSQDDQLHWKVRLIYTNPEFDAQKIDEYCALNPFQGIDVFICKDAKESVDLIKTRQKTVIVARIDAAISQFEKYPNLAERIQGIHKIQESIQESFHASIRESVQATIRAKLDLVFEAVSSRSEAIREGLYYMIKKYSRNNLLTTAQEYKEAFIAFGQTLSLHYLTSELMYDVVYGAMKHCFNRNQYDDMPEFELAKKLSNELWYALRFASNGQDREGVERQIEEYNSMYGDVNRNYFPRRKQKVQNDGNRRPKMMEKESIESSFNETYQKYIPVVKLNQKTAIISAGAQHFNKNPTIEKFNLPNIETEIPMIENRLHINIGNITESIIAYSLHIFFENHRNLGFLYRSVQIYSNPVLEHRDQRTIDLIIIPSQNLLDYFKEELERIRSLKSNFEPLEPNIRQLFIGLFTCLINNPFFKIDITEDPSRLNVLSKGSNYDDKFPLLIVDTKHPETLYKNNPYLIKYNLKGNEYIENYSKQFVISLEFLEKLISCNNRMEFNIKPSSIILHKEKRQTDLVYYRNLKNNYDNFLNKLIFQKKISLSNNLTDVIPSNSDFKQYLIDYNFINRKGEITDLIHAPSEKSNQFLLKIKNFTFYESELLDLLKENKYLTIHEISNCLDISINHCRFLKPFMDYLIKIKKLKSSFTHTPSNHTKIKVYYLPETPTPQDPYLNEINTFPGSSDEKINLYDLWIQYKIRNKSKLENLSLEELELIKNQWIKNRCPQFLYPWGTPNKWPGNKLEQYTLSNKWKNLIKRRKEENRYYEESEKDRIDFLKNYWNFECNCPKFPWGIHPWPGDQKQQRCLRYLWSIQKESLGNLSEEDLEFQRTQFVLNYWDNELQEFIKEISYPWGTIELKPWRTSAEENNFKVYWNNLSSLTCSDLEDPDKIFTMKVNTMWDFLMGKINSDEIPKGRSYNYIIRNECYIDLLDDPNEANLPLIEYFRNYLSDIKLDLLLDEEIENKALEIIDIFHYNNLGLRSKIKNVMAGIIISASILAENKIQTNIVENYIGIPKGSARYWIDYCILMYRADKYLISNEYDEFIEQFKPNIIDSAKELVENYTYQDKDKIVPCARMLIDQIEDYLCNADSGCIAGGAIQAACILNSIKYPKKEIEDLLDLYPGTTYHWAKKCLISYIKNHSEEEREVILAKRYLSSIESPYLVVNEIFEAKRNILGEFNEEMELSKKILGILEINNYKPKCSPESLIAKSLYISALLTENKQLSSSTIAKIFEIDCKNVRTDRILLLQTIKSSIKCDDPLYLRLNELTNSVDKNALLRFQEISKNINLSQSIVDFCSELITNYDSYKSKNNPNDIAAGALVLAFKIHNIDVKLSELISKYPQITREGIFKWYNIFSSFILRNKELPDNISKYRDIIAQLHGSITIQAKFFVQKHENSISSLISPLVYLNSIEFLENLDIDFDKKVLKSNLAMAVVKYISDSLNYSVSFAKLGRIFGYHSFSQTRPIHDIIEKIKEHLKSKND